MSGELWCWGGFDYVPSVEEPKPVPLPPHRVDIGEPVVELDAAGRRGCVRTRSGHIYCWGNHLSRLPDRWSSPTRIDGLERATRIELVSSPSCARSPTGSLTCWGADYFSLSGQRELSIATDLEWTNERLLEIDVSVLICIVESDEASTSSETRARFDLLCSNRHHVVAPWGPPPPAGPGDLKLVTRLDAAPAKMVTRGGTVCVLLTDGRLFCSQLDTETVESTEPPVALGDVRSFDISGAHACAARFDGSLWCWGYNASHQVSPMETGDYTAENPVLAPTPHPFFRPPRQVLPAPR